VSTFVFMCHDDGNGIFADVFYQISWTQHAR
jgi:hypothetical protein